MTSEISCRTRTQFSVLLTLLLAVALTVAGCNSSPSINEPVGSSSQLETPADSTSAVSKSSALLSVDDLKAMIAAGKVDSGEVVILDFGSGDYADGHIPGAIAASPGELVETRLEGVANAVKMVASGAKIDALVQRCGIDADSTVVITTSAELYYATRAYFTFRYWGFDRENIKLLDGGNAAWKAAGYATSTEVPAPTASTYSVADNGKVLTRMRASIGEVIQVVEGSVDGAVVIDTRSDADAGSYAGNFGVSKSYITDGYKTVLDGHPLGGKALSAQNLFANDGWKMTAEGFEDAETIKAAFASIGVDDSVTPYVYCTSGFIASIEFFALDGILGWPVALYDGSYSQWGQYSGEAAKGGVLPADSAWAVDDLMENPVYNADQGTLAVGDPQFVLLAQNLLLDPADEAANQVEGEDEAFIKGASYAKPAATPLVSVELLKKWYDDGRVKGGLVKEGVTQDVVILDLDRGAYAAGHIPGALQVGPGEMLSTRVEGVATAKFLVADAAGMNALVQSSGIDADTTVVLTTSGPLYDPSRAYFTFRYWGFPKANLKVLNGGNAAWEAAYGLVTDAEVLPTSSAYDVTENLVRDDLRASIAEVIQAVGDESVVLLDGRSDMDAGGYAGIYLSSPAKVSAGNAIMEGHPAGGKALLFQKLFANEGWNMTAGGFEDVLALADLFAAVGVDGDETTYTYCNTGFIASIGFFALDGILGYPAAVYDGSWSQWSLYSDNAAAGGLLPAGSPWAVDGLMENLVYNKNVGATVPTAADVAVDAASTLTPWGADANQVEAADIDAAAGSGAESGDDGDTGGAPGAGTGGGGGC